MNGKPSGRFGQYELAKLITVATFLASSGILTNVTGYLSSLNMGKWGLVIMAAWNLFLAFIYLIAKDNTPVRIISQPTAFVGTSLIPSEDQAGKNP